MSEPIFTTDGKALKRSYVYETAHRAGYLEALQDVMVKIEEADLEGALQWIVDNSAFDSDTYHHARRALEAERFTATATDFSKEA